MPSGRSPPCKNGKRLCKSWPMRWPGIDLEKALFLRRLLQSGRMEPNIYASGLSPDIELAVNHITQAIDNVLYETKIRREMFAQTATVLLGSGQGRTSENAAT
jgi:hypothetical protein